MLSRSLTSLLAPVAFLVVGLAIQVALPHRLDRSRCARLGFAYLLGSSFCGLLPWAASYLLGMRLSAGLVLLTVLAPVCAAVLSIALRGRRGTLRHLGRPAIRLGSPLAVVVAVVVGLFTASLLVDSMVSPVADFDGRMTWGVKTQMILSYESALPEPFREKFVLLAHPRYPILMPLVQVVALRLTGRPYDGFSVRPIYVLFLPALALVLWPSLRRIAGTEASAATLILILSTPLLLWDHDGGARGTYSDLPLGAFLGAGYLLLTRSRSDGNWSRGVAAGLLLAAAAATKNEGVVLASGLIAVRLAVTFWSWRGSVDAARRAVRPPVIAAAILLGFVAMFASWRAQIPNRYDEGYFERFSALRVLDGLGQRAERIAGDVWTATLVPSGWRWVLLVAALALTCPRGRLRWNTLGPAVALLTLHVLLFLAAYSLVENRATVVVTWNRLFIQEVVALSIVVAVPLGAAIDRLRGG